MNLKVLSILIIVLVVFYVFVKSNTNVNNKIYSNETFGGSDFSNSFYGAQLWDGWPY